MQSSWGQIVPLLASFHSFLNSYTIFPCLSSRTRVFSSLSTSPEHGPSWSFPMAWVAREMHTRTSAARSPATDSSLWLLSIGTEARPCPCFRHRTRRKRRSMSSTGRLLTSQAPRFIKRGTSSYVYDYGKWAWFVTRSPRWTRACASPM